MDKNTEGVPPPRMYWDTPHLNTFKALLRGPDFKPSNACAVLKDNFLLTNSFTSDAYFNTDVKRGMDGYACFTDVKKSKKLDEFLLQLLDYEQDMKKISVDTIEIHMKIEYGVSPHFDFSKEEMRLMQKVGATLHIEMQQIPEAPQMFSIISGEEDVETLLEQFKMQKKLDDLYWKWNEWEVNFWNVYSKKITLHQAFELGESYGRLIEKTKKS
jgi:transcriptional regulator CtsR